MGRYHNQNKCFDQKEGLPLLLAHLETCLTSLVRASLKCVVFLVVLYFVIVLLQGLLISVNALLVTLKDTLESLLQILLRVGSVILLLQLHLGLGLSWKRRHRK